MKISKEIVLKSGLLPKLQLGIKTGKGVKSTGPHKVKMIDDKLIQKPGREKDEEGQILHYVRYTVEENGERKQYDTRLKQRGGNDPSYFVQAMANIEPGEEITLEMKKAGLRNYVEIIRDGEVEHVDVDDDEEGPKDFSDEPNLE